MSLLSIVQSATARLGIAIPSAVYTSTDPQVKQLLALCNEEGKELSKRFEWQVLINEATFSTVATESQGNVNTIAPGWRYIINDTIWNRSLRRPVFGPLSNSDWAQQKAMVALGPWNQYKIEANTIKFIPVPSAGQTCSFSYITKYWLTSSDGLTGRDAWAADEDIAKLDEDIITLGLIWRWKQQKGLDYAEDFTKYEREILNAQSRDGTKSWLTNGGARYEIEPVVMVPAGNWGVS